MIVRREHVWIVLALGLLLFPVSPAAWAQTPPSSPAVAVSAEILVLTRSRPDGVALLKPNAGGTGDVTPFSSEDLLAAHRNSLRAALDVSLLGQRLQFSGMTLSGLKGRETRRPLDTVFPQDAAYAKSGADVDVSNSDTLHALVASRSSAFWSTEGNLAIDTRRFTGAAIDALVGVRVMQVRDKLQTIAYDNLSDYQGTTDQIDRVGVWARNHLLGPQIGLQGSVPLFGGLSIGGNAKLGYLRNDTSVGTSFSSDDKPDNGLGKTLSGRAWSTVMEINPQLTLALGNQVELFAGGMLLRMQGLAAADRQYAGVADADDTRIDRSGSTTFYGATLGLRIKLD